MLKGQINYCTNCRLTIHVFKGVYYDMKKIIFHDTTLRDGEQAPGINFDLNQKIEIALQLEKLGIRNIETGFVSSSESDFSAAVEISKKIKNSSIATLCRCVKKDIDISWEALKSAEEPQLLLFMPVSDIHIEQKLNKNRDEVLNIVENSIKHAKKFFPNVTFGAEDATRSDVDYLSKVFCTAIESGANCVSVGDTIGYLTPLEVKNFFSYLNNNVYSRYEGIDYEIHFHNDLGLATANVIEALKYGANRVSATMNGIGERAGNVSLEQVALVLLNKKEELGMCFDLDINELDKTCELVAKHCKTELTTNNSIMKNEYILDVLRTYVTNESKGM